MPFTNTTQLNRVVVIFHEESQRIKEISGYRCVTDGGTTVHHTHGELTPVQYDSGREDQIGFYDLSSVPSPIPAVDRANQTDVVAATAIAKETLSDAPSGDYSYAHRYVDETDQNHYDESDIAVSDILADTDNKGKIYGHMLAYDPIYQLIKAERDAAQVIADREAEERAIHNVIYYNYTASDSEFIISENIVVAPSFSERATKIGELKLYENEWAAYFNFVSDAANTDKVPVLSRYHGKLEYVSTAIEAERFKATLTKLPSALSDVSGLEICIPVSVR